MPLHDGDLPRHEAILDRLRDELEQAKALYDGAKEAYEKAKKEYDDLSASPSSALRRATEVHEFALDIYKLAVQRFNGYLLRGDVPSR